MIVSSKNKSSKQKKTHVFYMKNPKVEKNYRTQSDQLIHYAKYKNITNSTHFRCRILELGCAHCTD